MAKSASAFNAGLANPHDQKNLNPAVIDCILARKIKDRKAEKFRNVQNESCSEQTRKSSAVL
jgi:hypothetical protein